MDDRQIHSRFVAYARVQKSLADSLADMRDCPDKSDSPNSISGCVYPGLLSAGGKDRIPCESEKSCPCYRASRQ